MLILLLAIILTLTAPALARKTCTTVYDKDFQVYRTRCSDGRSYRHRYDKDFQRWRTEVQPLWKELEERRKKMHSAH